ncbi:MAG TPA: NAD-dependent epimerase/dehydratase family protein [Gemmataceae bacterium]|jgi:UDP-glucose 4-epimerase|nr:NAD-dependent epimerase/dehydratase family protein [Gemmataceae bacterium]
MNTALVTGGAGFLGSHVAEHVLAMGMRVVVLDDLSGGFRRNVPSGCELCIGSVEDRRLINKLFKRYRFRFVYHLAAYAAEGLSHFIRHFNYRVNLLGSVNLINAAVNWGTECFVFTSSAAVYGSATSPFTEQHVPHPEDPYGIAKLAVESDLRAATALWSMKHVIFRPHNVYGERQNLADRYRNVVGIFMNQVLSGRPCTIFGDGTQTRNFSYVGDVAPIIATAVGVADAANRTFNIGASESCSVNELARFVQAALGRCVGVEYLAPRPEARHVNCVHDQIAEVFRRHSTVGLADGIARTADWAKTVELGLRKPPSSIEIQKGLPAMWAGGQLYSAQKLPAPRAPLRERGRDCLA